MLWTQGMTERLLPSLICIRVPVPLSICTVELQAQPAHRALRAGFLYKPEALWKSPDNCHLAMPVGDQGQQGSGCG